MLKLRLIGIRDYAVLGGTLRIDQSALPASGCQRLALERHRPLARDLPMGSARDIDTAKAEFKAAWETLKARTTPERLAAAYKAMNIRDDG